MRQAQEFNSLASKPESQKLLEGYYKELSGKGRVNMKYFSVTLHTNNSVYEYVASLDLDGKDDQEKIAEIEKLFRGLSKKMEDTILQEIGLKNAQAHDAEFTVVEEKDMKKLEHKDGM
jgi:hypothetical protein